MPIRPDGTVPVAIDTLPAKELTATRTTVRDHRRGGRRVAPHHRRHRHVLVARKPFKVFTWVDRGHYRAGDTIKAGFQAQTLDHKPVAGKGTLKLFQISLRRQGQAGREGRANLEAGHQRRGPGQQTIKAAGAGPVPAVVHDRRRPGHTIEGGYLFAVPGRGFDGATSASTTWS